MKTKIVLVGLAIAAVAAAGGWFAARRTLHPGAATSPAGTKNSGRKVLYYQSPMHPWIKSDKPGRCTICGMELSPVYEGERGFETAEGIVTLGTNSIQVIHAQSEPAQRRPLRRAFRFAGTIDDNDATHRFVSAYLDGRIDRLDVNYVGAEVVAGEPLATLYSPTLLAAEREYVALRKQVATGLAEEHERLTDAAAQRLKRLGLADSQIARLPQKDPDNIHTEILAPVSGTVVTRFVYEGQYAKEGDKLFEIADFSTMWFVFDAYERDLAWLKPGQRVIVTTPAVPGKSFAGAIAFIDPNLKEMTRSAKVRVELPNPIIETNGVKRRELYHKLYAEAVVQVEIPEVLTVPRSAVLSPGAVPVVYVDKGGGAYEQRKVRLGRAGDDDYEMLDGIEEGERVVTQGNMLLDAQAQLQASASQGAMDQHQHGGPITQSASPPEQKGSPEGQAARKLPPLTESQKKSVKDFLALADAITAALAADNLNEFNAQAQKTHRDLPALSAAFETASPWRPLLRPIEATGHLTGASDLKSARKAFHPLSQAVVEFTKALRQAEADFSSMKVFRCPMTKDAFPGAPRTAEWIQMKAPIHNPYFGAEMLDCGSEVKP